MSDSFTPDFAAIGQAPPAWTAKRPMRIAILGDFGAGAGRGRLQTGAELAERKPLKVEFDTLEDAMQRLHAHADAAARRRRRAGGRSSSPMLDAFHPDAVYANVPVFAELASLRKRLQPARSVRRRGGRGHGLGRQRRPACVEPGAQGRCARQRALARRDARRLRTADRPAVGAPRRPTALSVACCGASSARSSQAAASPNKDALVAAVDSGLSDAMRAVLHHPDFQTSESLWRGVDFVLRRLETGPSCRCT